MKTVFAVLIALLWSSSAYALDEVIFLGKKEVASLSTCIEASKNGVELNGPEKHLHNSRMFLTVEGAVYQLMTTMHEQTVIVACNRWVK